jgi:large subunit ribosomal protein L35
MPKMKTHKGCKKRLKLSAKGKLRHKRPNAGHLMSGKSGDRCRSLRKARTLEGAVAKRIKTALRSA